MAGEQDWSHFNDDQFMEQMLGESLDKFAGHPENQPAPVEPPKPAQEAVARATRNVQPEAPIVAPQLIEQPTQMGLGLSGGAPSWARNIQTPDLLRPQPAPTPKQPEEIDLLANKKKPKAEAEQSVPSYLLHGLESGLYSAAGMLGEAAESLNPVSAARNMWLSIKDTAHQVVNTMQTGDFVGDTKSVMKTRAAQSASTPLTRFAENMQREADELAQSPDGQKYNELVYATTDPSKSALLSPVRMVHDLLQSLPSTAAMATTVYLTRGAAAKAYGEAVAAGFSKSEATAIATKAAGRVASLAGALGEGTVGGLQGETGARTTILDDANLSHSPVYKAMVEAGVSEDDARQYVATQIGNEAGAGAAAVDAITNALEGPILGRIIGEGGKLVSRVAKGAATEAVQEGIQSGGEQLTQNAAIKDLGDPQQALADGVAESIVAGFAVGGLSGGLFAGTLGGGVHKDAQPPVDGEQPHSIAPVQPEVSGEPVGVPAGEGPEAGPVPAPVAQVPADEGVGGMQPPAPAAADTPFGPVGSRVTVDQGGKQVGGRIVAAKPVSNPQLGAQDVAVQIELDDGSVIDQLAGTLAKSGVQITPEQEPGGQIPEGAEPLESAPVTDTPPPAEATSDSALPQTAAGEPASQTPTTAPAPQPAEETPVHDLADSVHRTLMTGGSYENIQQLRKEAAPFYGDKITSDTDEAKRVEEEAELGVVMAARDIAAEDADAGETYGKLVDLYERQPNLLQRSTTSVANQAYSTPAPLAYAASRLANVSKDDRVYEPTAGNGMLLIEADPANVVANEKNPDRVAALQRVFPEGEVTEGDALESQPDGEFDVVISNPPFGTVKDMKDGRFVEQRFDHHAGFPTTQVDHAIALKALRKMKKDGRAVLIVGAVGGRGENDRQRQVQYRGNSQIRFYSKLFADYNVVDLFTVDGDLYKKQGAQWPVNVIVIEGKGGDKSTAVPPYKEAPRVLKSWDELGAKVDASVYAPGELPGDGNSDVAGDAAVADQPESVSDDAGGTPSASDVGSGSGRSGRSAVEAGDAGKSEPARQPAESGVDNRGEQSGAPRSGGVSSGTDTAESVDTGPRDGTGDRTGGRDGVSGSTNQVDVAKTFEKEGKSAADKLTDLAASGNKDAQGLIDRLTADDRAPKSNGGKVEVTIMPNTAKTVLLFDPSKRLESLIRNAIPKASIDYSSAKEGWVIPSRWTDQLKKTFDVVEDQPHSDAGAEEIRNAQLEAEKARAERERAEAERARAEAERAKAEAARAKQPEPETDNISDALTAALDERFGKKEAAPTLAGGMPVEEAAKVAKAADARPLSAKEQAELDDLNARNDEGLLMDDGDALRRVELARRQRTAGQAAQSAATNSKAALQEATSALVTMFNDMAKDQSGSLNAPDFDNATYQKAKAHFAAALENMKSAARDVADMARALVNHLADNGMTRAGIEKMMPYLQRFIQEVRAGVIKIGQAVKSASQRKENTEEETEYQVQYEPRSDAEAVGTLVPRSMQDALNDAFDKMEMEVGDINQFVARELGYEDEADLFNKEDGKSRFSAEQVDALALAIHNAKNGKGFIIGDQTGVGKGRFVAGMLRWGMLHGKTPIFVTKDAGLYADMVRDLRDIGMDDVNIFVSNRDLRGKNAIPLSDDPEDVLKTPANDATHKDMLKKIAMTGKLPEGYDMYFTAYSQNQYTKGRPSLQMPALEALAEGGMLVMDESHLAGGTAKERAKMDKDGNVLDRSGYFRSVVGRANSVVYSSATYAKNPHTMTLYTKTDMGLAVSDPKELPHAMEQGGVPLQQVVANMLVKAGQYVRRERTFAGVHFAMEEIPIDEKRAEVAIDLIREIFDLDVAVMQDAREDFIEHLASEGEIAAGDADGAVGAESASGTTFAAVMHNVANQLLMSLKTTSIANWAIDEIKQGRKPLIAVVNTNDSIIGDYVEEEKLEFGDRVDIPFNVILTRYLDRLRRITVTDKETDEKRYYWMSLQDIEDFMGPEAREAYERAKEVVADADLSGLSASPLDTIMDRIRASGAKVGEITGRKRTLKNNVLTQREASNAEKKRTMNGFNTGKLDALLLNVSGSTGYSMHATNKDGNDGKQRSMMIAQPDPDINVFMQMLGRIHRTGQVKLPRYVIASSNLAAERRVTAILMNKMASLNANTTANAESATTLKGVVNFVNSIGDKVVIDFLAQHPDIRDAMALKQKDDGTIEDAARKFVNRTILLRPKVAEEIIQTVETEYAATLEALDAIGENSLEAPVMELDAQTVKKNEFVPAKESEDSPFAAPAFVETVSVRKLGRPMKPDEIKSEISDFLDKAEIPESEAGVRPTRWAEKLKEKMQELLPQHLEGAKASLAKAREALAAARTERQRELGEERVANWERSIHRSSEQIDAIGDALMLYRPGRIFNIRMGDDENVTAVSLGVDMKPDSNPASPSNFVAKFAVSSATRKIGIPLSQLLKAEDEGARFTVYPRGMSWDMAMREFDIPEDVRENRTVFTGNIFSAFAKLPKGQIIQMRREDGSLEPAVFMKRGFDLKKEMDSQPVRFFTLDQIVQFIETVQHTLVGSLDPRGAIQFQRESEWTHGSYRIRVGGKYGKTYAGEHAVNAIGGGDFNRRSQRGQFEKIVDREGLERAFAFYQRLGIDFGTATNKDEARKIADPETAALLEKRLQKQMQPATNSTRRNVQLSADRAALLKRFRRILDNMGLHDVGLRIERYLDGEQFGQDRVDGIYDPVENLISVAQSADGLEWTVGHEVIHALRAMDLFDPIEWRALARSVTPEELAKIKQFYPEVTPEGQMEEAIAEKFGQWFAQRNGQTGFVRRAFEKIVRFFEALRDALTDNDPTDPDRIFRRIERGDIGSREGGVTRQGPPGEYRAMARKKKLGDDNRPDRNTRKQAADDAVFSDEETEKRWQNARDGVASPETMLARATTHFRDWARNFTRHHKALPNEPRFADVMQQLRKLEAAPENAREDIIRYLKGLTNGFTQDDMELFARKVVLDDLMFDLDKERDLPFGLTEETLPIEHKNVTEQIRKAGLEDAVNNRRLVVQTVADDMVRFGVLTKEQIENPYYYRHMVLDFAAAAVTVTKNGKTKTVRKPYWHGRRGSLRDINANILEAEMDWMYKALVDIQAAKTIDWIKKSPLNIRKSVAAAARAHNDDAMQALIQEDIEANGFRLADGEMTSPLNEKWKEYQRKIAIGIDGVRRVLRDGHLTNIPPHLQASAQAIMDQETTDEGFFGLFSWIMDNGLPGAASAGAAFNGINARREFMQTSLGKNFANTRDMASLVSKGFAPEGYAIWQPDPGKLMFTSKVITEHALDRFALAVAGEDMDVDDAVKAAFKEQAKEVLMVGGDKYQFIIPEELAETLDNFSDARTEDMLQNLVTMLTTGWKRWILFSPRRAFKYMLNNVSGDIDAVIAGNGFKGALAKIPQATREVLAVAKGGAPSERYMDARERAVFGSAITAQEVEQIEAMDEFKHIARAKGDDGIPKRLARAYFQKIMGINNARETILRYAAYLDYIEKIEAGKTMQQIGYGASVPDMVNAVSDLKDKAALLSRDLLGDYGAISVNGRKLRRGIFPFFSWMEINTKRYWRLTANAWNTGRGKGIVTGSLLATGAAARAGLWLGLRMAVVSGAIHMWNWLFFHDDEEKLELSERMQLHMFVPSWDGETKSIRVSGALWDALGWFGFADVATAYDMAQKHQLDAAGVGKAIFGAPINKIVSQTTPMIKTPIEMVTGQQYWPDVFEPYPVRDNWKHLFKTFSLDNEYTAARNLAADAGVGNHHASRGYFNSLAETVVYSRDPGEIQYNRVRGLAARFEANRTGDSGYSGGGTTNSRLLYEYRTALRYGDHDTAEEIKKELLDLRDPVDGHRINTPKKLRQAAVRQQPLYSIPKRYRDDFLRTLDDDQKQAVKDADKWWRETFM